MNVRLKVIGANQTEVCVGGKYLFFSYDTLVAALIGGKYYRADPKTVEKWSKTTTKHVNSWCLPNAYTVTHRELEIIAND